MKICVLVKEVPDAAVEKRMDQSSKRLDRSGETTLNQFDTHAIEAAMQIREGGAVEVDEIVAVTMAPSEAGRTLNKAVALAKWNGLLWPLMGFILGVAVLAGFTGLSLSNRARQVANAHTFFNLGISLVFLPFTPLAARMFARHDREGINQLYWQTAIWIAVLSFPLFALTFSLADPLTVTLFGERYEGSAVYLSLLALGYYFNAALGFNGLTLKVYGRLRYIVTINILAALSSAAAAGMWFLIAERVLARWLPARWQRIAGGGRKIVTIKKPVGTVTSFTMKGMSKDNYFFGVRAIDKDGNKSPVTYPRPQARN